MISFYPKDMGERNGFFLGIVNGVGCLFLETINRTNARHDSITNIHQHTRREQKGPNTQQSHDTNQLSQDWMKHTFRRVTKKVIPPQE
jgi:hypothetical protein